MYLCKSQTATATIPAGAGSLQHGFCAVIKAASDKSRGGISPQEVLDHVKQHQEELCRPPAAAGLQTTGLDSPCAPLLGPVLGCDHLKAVGEVLPSPTSNPGADGD